MLTNPVLLLLVLVAQVESQPSQNQNPDNIAPTQNAENSATGQTQKSELAARAQTEDAGVNSRFSLGGGISLTGEGQSVLGQAMSVPSTSLGSLSSVAMPGQLVPTVGVFAEYAITDNLWFLMKIYGGYGYQETDNKPIAMYYLNNYFAGTSIGNRFCFNPNSGVQLSLYYTLHISYNGSSNHVLTTFNDEGVPIKTGTTSTTTNGLSAGLQLGIILEKELLEDFYVRLQIQALGLEGGYTSGERTVGNSSATQTYSLGFDSKLSFSPSLELRYRF